MPTGHREYFLKSKPSALMSVTWLGLGLGLELGLGSGFGFGLGFVSTQVN